jgi:hypothetical protein
LTEALFVCCGSASQTPKEREAKPDATETAKKENTSKKKQPNMNSTPSP